LLPVPGKNRGHEPERIVGFSPCGQRQPLQRKSKDQSLSHVPGSHIAILATLGMWGRA